MTLLVTASSCAIMEEPASSTNSLYTLHFKNYLGNTENIHPKVLYFPEKWNGYKFWMAYTPYPKGDIDAENPCIAVSNDGIMWEIPEGLSNPLAYAPKGGYNSDTHLVYDAKHNRLECWWREFDIDSGSDAIVRRISPDGVHWDPKVTLIPFDKSKGMRLSPTVWIQDGKYHMIYSHGSLLKYIHTDIEDVATMWSDPVDLPIDWDILNAWHHDMTIDENGDWELIVCAYERWVGNNNSADLYYVKVKSDLSEATKPELILQRGPEKDDFDHRSIYRSSILKVNGLYYIYYSAIAEDWSRHMALLRGPSIFNLKGLEEQDVCE